MTNDEIFEQEEKCLKSIRTVRKAVIMRVVVTVLLVWAMIASGMEPIAVVLMVLVLLINLVGALPLIGEWKKQKQRLNDLIDMEE